MSVIGCEKWSIFFLLKVSLHPMNWAREDIIFFTEHGPFPAYLKRFGLARNDFCTCGGFLPSLQLLLFAFLLPSLGRQLREISMRSCRCSVCFLLLMDSQNPRVGQSGGNPLDEWCTVVPSVSIGWCLATFVVRSP
ncbi:hypothetical protein AVEN_228179-1 [Araneus ventricosus]|uniref:Uncharacterized protein n=1 Tax=Araneus ventricosus TaxID=182803 RepID=A0A4Y2CTD7_ARAVE|nr:hypothetical protein AVEN_228179-1 [Araneus ventricosus]